MKILFYIGSLKFGGKERRLVELLSFLKNKNEHKMLVVLTSGDIEYQKFLDLGIEYLEIKTNKQNSIKDIQAIFRLCKIVNEYKPDIIHTWGVKQTFQVIPIARKNDIPLVNSQITSAPPILTKKILPRLVNFINFKFSSCILANSYAGLYKFGVDKLPKARVIYNGLDMKRFENLIDKQIVKKRFNITTSYLVVMVASFSESKDYNRFVSVAKYVTSKKNDVSFIGVGRNDFVASTYEETKEKVKSEKRIILHGPIKEVEELINASDIGILFTASGHGEGISNSILEYMALGKPVIADECGGNAELIDDGQNGYFTSNRTIEDIGDLIINLLSSYELRKSIGANNVNTINARFTLDKMGRSFESAYEFVIKKHIDG